MKKRVAYRKRQQNRLGMFLVTLVVLMIMVVVAYRSVGLQEQIDAKDAEIEALKEQIEAEDERAQEIEEYRKYTQTKGFYEEIAKDKLGLVYEGEIIFKSE